jgi:hypothetical protein
MFPFILFGILIIIQFQIEQQQQGRQVAPATTGARDADVSCAPGMFLFYLFSILIVTHRQQ